MKHLLSLTALLFLATGLRAQVLTFEPERPESGESVTVTYHPEAEGALLSDGPLFLVDYQFREEYDEHIPMKETRRGWVAEFQPLDDFRFATFGVRSDDAKDDNEGKQWDLFQYEDGKIAKGAWSSRARMKQRHLAEGTDINAFRLGHYQTELANYPDNVSMQASIWGLQLKMGMPEAPIQHAARALAEGHLATGPDDLTVFNQTKRIYTQAGLDELAEALDEQYKANPPNAQFEASYARQGYAENVTEQQDVARKIEWLNAFLEEHGSVAYGSPRGDAEPPTYNDIYGRTLLNLHIELGNTTEILALATDVFDGTGDLFRRGSARTAREVAIALARNGGDLDKARDYARLAADLEAEEYDYESMRPISFDPPKFRVIHGKEAEAKAFRSKLSAENRIALAYVDAKDGRVERSLRSVEAAIQDAPESTDALMLLGEVRGMAGLHEEAFDAFRQVAMLSPGHAEARRHLKQSWIEANGSDAGYYEAVTQIEDAWRMQRAAELVEERGTEAAPDFVTTYLASGEAVTRADLLGKVVVIDFWATWCGPCLKAFPDLNKTWLKYRERPDVVFLVVNTGWSNEQDDAEEFAESHDYTFPYTMDHDEAMTDAFRVSGIPTTVVLDAEGREAFRHLGYSGPDYVAELSLEIDLLLGDYVLVQQAAGDD